MCNMVGNQITFEAAFNINAFFNEFTKHRVNQVTHEESLLCLQNIVDMSFDACDTVEFNSLFQRSLA